MHDQLVSIVQAHPYPLLFATVTGSHAFGCASPTSDYDVHGCHLLPIEEVLLSPIHAVLGVDRAPETIERKAEGKDGVEVDIATHDLQKFILLLLKGSGGMLEDIYSPLVVVTSPLHEELRELARGCITKQVALYYKGMAHNQQRRLKANELKKLLHIYRCLLMGTYLMQTGVLEMNLPCLADEYRLPVLHRLLAYKQQGFDFLPDEETTDHMKYIEMLTAGLEEAREQSQLPETATTRKKLEQLLIRVRLEGR